jgi:hypothetical protein
MSRGKKIVSNSLDLAIECFGLILEWLEECWRAGGEESRGAETIGEHMFCVSPKGIPPRLQMMQARRYYAVNPGMKLPSR